MGFYCTKTASATPADTQTHTELNPERSYVQLGVNKSFARNPDHREDLGKAGVGMIRELNEGVWNIPDTLLYWEFSAQELQPPRPKTIWL